MIWPQNTRTVILVAAGTLATNATATARLDTLGYDYATIEVVQGPSAATNSSAKWASLFFSEGDTTTAASSANITALVGTTNTSATSGFVIQGNNDNTTGIVHKFQIALNGRRRYLFLNGQPHQTNSTVFVKAELTRAQQSPDTDTERNVALTTIV
jgi:hypothetical protein